MKLYDAIQTEYAGYRFRSRREAKWAVFLDACGVDWEYEPEGYDLGDGLKYLPDFLLHDVAGRAHGDLYVEVKGVMTAKDAEKIRRFSQMSPVLVLGRIPRGNMSEVTRYISHVGCRSYYGVCLFNFKTIDGVNIPAHPGVNRRGKFEVFADEYQSLKDRDDFATAYAYRMARQARFEFGETPEGRMHHA